jgi:hypothetical protein
MILKNCRRYRIETFYTEQFIKSQGGGGFKRRLSLHAALENNDSG